VLIFCPHAASGEFKGCMSKIVPAHLVLDWMALLADTDATALRCVRAVAVQEQAALASHFYENMLQDAEASKLLSYEQVKVRLNASMMRWIVGVFGAHDEASVRDSVMQQVHVGTVHARIDVPVHLVLRGARSLKNHFYTLLRQQPLTPAQCAAAGRMVEVVMDVCMQAMSQAYLTHHDRVARSSEAYRLHAVAHNLSTDRERQRAALLDWENTLMFECAMGHALADLPRIGASDFGLWFRHKGAHAFQGTSESEQILRSLDCIDTDLLPQFAQPTPDALATQKLLRQVREQCKGLAFHLDVLFEQSQALDAGRDVLTQLLNRKFLPVVMGKEVRYARDRSSTFAVLLLDIDHFKQVNDSHGHAAGDIVLQHMAAVLTNVSRGADYVFRLGGEEFLLLLVDINQEQALCVAERLRTQVQRESVVLPNNATVPFTVSIGMAMDDGNPDYEQIVRRADEALYKAKNGGRNRVVMV
jgi:diguanylate cyclase